MAKQATATQDDNVIKFKPAKREGVGLFIGVAGNTGSGKTFTALRLARGIVGPKGRIAAADTEGRRMSHYAGMFGGFDVTDLDPPFRPEKFADLAKAAEEQGYGVLVIDSFSHEWAGDGGVLDWHDEELDRAVAKALQYASENENVNEEAVRNRNNIAGWIKPKAAHKAMVNSFLQRKIPIIFCMRAEEKIKVGSGGKPESQGFMPICDPKFGYELTVMFTLTNENPGRVNYKLPRKLQEQHLKHFPDGKFVTEEAGAALAAWARGEDVLSPEQRVKKGAADVIAQIIGCKDAKAVGTLMAKASIAKQIEWLSKNNKPLYDDVMIAQKNKLQSFGQAA